MTTDEHVAEIKARAEGLAEAIKAALAENVSEAFILPTLIGVLQESGLMPSGLPFGI